MKVGSRTVLRYLAFASIAALAARAGLTILREPCVGVADNLDYWRVARPAGIHVEPQPKQGTYMVCSYNLAEPDLKESLTSSSLLAWLATGYRWSFDVPADKFDVRQLGFLYWLASAAVLIAAFFAGVNALVVLMIAWVFYDPGFLLFFNSLYADPALIIGLLSVVLLLLLDPFSGPESKSSRAGSIAVLFLLILAAALAGFSKMQYASFPGVLLCCCALALAFLRRLPNLGQAVFLVVLAALALAAPLYFLYGPAPRFLDVNNYNAVFGGIARAAGDPPAALAALGIPQEYRRRKPKDYFAAAVTPEDPVMPPLRKLSRWRLARLYLTDRAALVYTAHELQGDLTKVRTHPRGNFTREENGRHPRFYQSPEQFSLWRARLLNWIPLWPHLLLGGVAVFLGFRAIRGRWTGTDTAFLLLFLWVTSQFAVAILGDGFSSLHQHLLGARLGLDLLLALIPSRLALLASTGVYIRSFDARGWGE